MNVDRTAARVGVGLAALPVFSHAVLVAVLEVVYSGLFTSAEASAIFDAAYGPVATTTALLIFGMLLVAPAAAFYLAFPEERAAGPVAGGFAAGAVVYGVGLGAGAWVSGMGTPFPGGAPRFAVWPALLFGGTGALGALAGDTVGPLFRTPEGADEQHPRW